MLARDYDDGRDLSCVRSFQKHSRYLALRGIIARGRTRSRAVFDCSKLEAVSQATYRVQLEKYVVVVAASDARVAALCAKVGRPCR